MAPMTSVRVLEVPIGDSTFARATADCFEPDVLTVTWVDSGRVARVFQPDRWAECLVYQDGRPAFGFVNRHEARPHSQPVEVAASR